VLDIRQILLPAIVLLDAYLAVILIEEWYSSSQLSYYMYRLTPCDFPIQWFAFIGLLLGLPLTAAADVIARHISFRTAFGFEIFAGCISMVMFFAGAYLLSSHELSSCVLLTPRLWEWLKLNTLVNSVTISSFCVTVILSSSLIMVSSRVKPHYEPHTLHRFKTYYGTV
jgi:hypothetical protein